MNAIKEKNKKITSSIKKFYTKKILKNKKKFNLKETLLFMIITFAFGLVLGGIFMYKRGFLGSNDLLYEFASTYNEIVDSYYTDVDSDKLLESGISGMMRYLGDPYSSFMTKESAQAFSEDVEGKYSGIGAEIKFDDKLENILIGRVFEGSPAEKAGIKENDMLLKVNNEPVKGKSLSDIASIVKGEEKTEVTVTVIRDEKEMEFKIKRGTVDSVSVLGKIIEKDEKKIGYLAISVFAVNTLDQFKKELENLEKESIDALIIDVRGNSGGYLTSVTDMISLFTKKGDVLYQLKAKNDIEIIKDNTNESRNYKIVVLTNSGSASASEVLAASLKESYGATIVGTKSFGKGKVQKVYTLSNGSMIKYTNQEWLTPKGNSIDGEGLTPDVIIEYVYDSNGKDNQLDKAVEVILEK